MKLKRIQDGRIGIFMDNIMMRLATKEELLFEILQELKKLNKD